MTFAEQLTLKGKKISWIKQLSKLSPTTHKIATTSINSSASIQPIIPVNKNVSWRFLSQHLWLSLDYSKCIYRPRAFVFFSALEKKRKKKRKRVVLGAPEKEQPNPRFLLRAGFSTVHASVHLVSYFETRCPKKKKKKEDEKEGGGEEKDGT